MLCKLHVVVDPFEKPVTEETSNQYKEKPIIIIYNDRANKSILNFSFGLVHHNRYLFLII